MFLGLVNRYMGKWLLQGCCEPLCATCRFTALIGHSLCLPALPTLLPRMSPVSRLKAKCGISHTAVWSVLACADLCFATDTQDVQVAHECPSFYSVFPCWVVIRHVWTFCERSSISLSFCFLLCLLFSQLQSLMRLEPGSWLSWSWSCLHIEC